VEEYRPWLVTELERFKQPVHLRSISSRQDKVAAESIRKVSATGVLLVPARASTPDLRAPEGVVRQDIRMGCVKTSE
jgi:hypothetical protein